MAASAIALLAVRPFRGAVLLTLTARNGVDTGDLLALPPLVAAVTILKGRLPRPEAWGTPTLAPFGAAILLIGALEASGAMDWVPSPVALLLALALLGLGTIASLAVWAAARPAVGATGRHRCRSAHLAPVALGAGYLLDTALGPSGTVMGPLLLAALLSLQGPRTRRVRYLGVAGVLLLVNVAALADVAGLDSPLASRGGGGTRTIALGLVFAVGGLGRGSRHDAT